VRFLRANDFTLLHSYLTYANVVMCIAGTLARVPVIASLRNIKPNPEYYNPVIYRIETFCLRHLARRVMANGYAIGDLNRARVGKEIVVIPNSIEVPARLPEAERTRLRKALGGDAHRTIVISVGRLVAVKGFPMIIDAVHQLRSRFPDLLLLIAGDGDQQAELENQVAALQLQDHVRLLGKRDDVPALLDASDVYVSASSMEGMSVAILEAMAAGLPVIATDTGDAARVVVAGTGFIIPVGQIQPLVDGLAALLADAPGRAQMGSAARERVASTYNTTAWTDQFLKLYQEIAEK
jgi:glycosyltransferase involved in cell wall biosynthesis